MLKRLFLPLLVVLAVRVALFADAVILQSGERIEGTIISESSTEIVMEVEVASGIIDRKTFDRADVRRVDKASPDQAAFEEINDLKPGENSLTLSGYNQAADRLKTFLSRFPESTFATVVQERIEALSAEKERVRAGEMKLNGQWLSPDEVEVKRYQISAKLLFEQMKQAGAAGDYVSALNAFDRIERDYKGSRVYPEALPVARQLVAALAVDVSRRQKMLARDEEERQAGLAITSEPKKTELLRAYEQEQAQFNALLDEAKNRSIKWNPLLPRSKASLTTLEETARKEEDRLANIESAGMQQSLRDVDAAVAAMENEDYDGAEERLSAATKAWSDNEAARRAQTRLKELRAGAKEKEAAEEAAEPEAEATPMKPRKPAKKSSPAPETPAPEATPASETTPAAAVNSPPMSAIAHDEPEAKDEEKPFFLTIPGAAAIAVGVVVLAGAISIIGKVKRPRRPNPEP